MSMLHRALLRRHPTLDGIPGPKPRFPLGNITDFKHGLPWRTSLDYARRYGPYTLFWLGNRPAVFVHDPAGIETILIDKRESFVKVEPTDAMRPAATESNMFIANGAAWAERRRLDFFSCEHAGAWLSERFIPTQEFIGRRLGALPRGDVGGFERSLYRLVFDIQSFLCFGRRIPERDFRAYNKMTDVVDLRMKSNLPLVTPGFHRSIGRWHRAVSEQLAVNEDDPNGRSLSHLLARSTRLPRAQLVTELANVYPGGVFSMTVGLVHALACLAADGRARDRARAAASALGEGGAVTYAALTECAEIEGVLRESLRLFPPAPVFMRSVRADEVQVGPYRLPKGLRVLVGVLPLHRDPDHWRYADEFIPERWDAETLAANPYGSGYFFPFGRGPRTCGGEALARFVLRSALYCVLAGMGPEMILAKPEDYRFYFGCMMPKGVQATVAERG